MIQDYKAVVVGVSAGGMAALWTIVSKLREGFPLPVAVVQHRRPDFGDFLAVHLSGQSPLPVKEADVYQDEVIGVILTGANSDGSQGLKHIEQRGGLTVVQDPVSAEADRMPREAIKATRESRVLSVEDIAPFLMQCSPTAKTHAKHTATMEGR